MQINKLQNDRGDTEEDENSSLWSNEEVQKELLEGAQKCLEFHLYRHIRINQAIQVGKCQEREGIWVRRTKHWVFYLGQPFQTIRSVFSNPQVMKPRLKERPSAVLHFLSLLSPGPLGAAYIYLDDSCICQYLDMVGVQYIFIEVQLMHNVSHILEVHDTIFYQSIYDVSDVQQRDSVICIYMYIIYMYLFSNSFPFWLLQDTEYSSLCYTGPYGLVYRE